MPLALSHQPFRLAPCVTRIASVLPRRSFSFGSETRSSPSTRAAVAWAGSHGCMMRTARANRPYPRSTRWKLDSPRTRRGGFSPAMSSASPLTEHAYRRGVDARKINRHFHRVVGFVDVERGRALAGKRVSAELAAKLRKDPTHIVVEFAQVGGHRNDVSRSHRGIIRLRALPTQGASAGRSGVAPCRSTRRFGGTVR